MVAEVKHGHYKKDVSHLKVLDVYRIQELWTMHPCAEHVVKKMLVAGGRGHKDLDKDIQDCIDTLQRWQDMRKEDGQVIDAACNDEPGARLLNGWFDIAGMYQWAATDPDGSIWAYIKKPQWQEHSSRWIPSSGDPLKLSAGPAVDIEVAKSSLEQRPT